MSNSSEIVAEAEGPDRERSRGRRMRNLDWWPVRVGHGCVGCLYAEEGGRRSGVRERPGLSPAVMAINLLLSSNGDKLDYL